MRRSKPVLLRSITAATLGLLWLLCASACGGSSDGGSHTTTPPDTTPTQTPTPPAAPTGLTATSASASSVTLTWTRNSSNETGFQVERSTGGSGTFSLLATTAAAVTTYSDTALTANTLYNYRIRAVGSAGTSAYSNVASLTTPTACPAATAVTQDIGTPTTWTAGAAGCVHYHVTAVINLKDRLTISPGTVVSFSAGAGLTVANGGSLGAFGTPSAGIRFTGDQPARGYWKGITFLANNAANDMSYTTVSYGGGDGTVRAADVAVIGNPQLNLSHSVLEQSAGVGLYLDTIAVLGPFTADTMRNNAGAGVRLPDRLIGALDNTSSYSAGNGIQFIDAFAWDVSVPQLWQVTTTPIHVTGQVNLSADLVIAAGVNLQFGADAGMTVAPGGSLSALGTAASRIQFSAEKQQRGSWHGLSILTNNTANRLSFASVSYGGGGTGTNVADVSVANGASLQLDNSVLEQSAGVGLYATGSATLPAFSANTFRNNVNSGVRVTDQLVGSLDAGSDYATGNGAAFVDATAFGVSTTQTWSIASIPIRTSGQTTISGRLTLVPGTTVLVGAGGGWNVMSGTLTAIGTSTSRIRFLGQQSTAGYWQGLVFSTASSANELTFTEIAYGGAAGFIRAAAIEVANGGTLRLTNSNVHDGAGWGLFVELNGVVTPTPVASAGNVFTSNALGGSNIP